MNNNLIQDIKKVYESMRLCGYEEILSIPRDYSKICAPLKVIVKANRDNSLTLTTNKLGVLGKVHLNDPLAGGGIIGVSESSLITEDEAKRYLRRTGTMTIPAVDAVKIFARSEGEKISKEVIKILDGKKPSSPPMEIFKDLIAYFLNDASISPRMLYAFLLAVENAKIHYDRIWPVQYEDFIASRPIKVDKIVRPLRLVDGVIAGEMDYLIYSLATSDNHKILADFMPQVKIKDCDAARKFHNKVAIADINYISPLLMEAIQVCMDAKGHPTFD